MTIKELKERILEQNENPYFDDIKFENVKSKEDYYNVYQYLMAGKCLADYGNDLLNKKILEFNTNDLNKTKDYIDRDDTFAVYEINMQYETGIKDKFIKGFKTKQEAEEFINETQYRRDNYYWIRIVPGGVELKKNFSNKSKGDKK